MSNRKSNKNKNKPKQIPVNALLYCPDYMKFDKKARMDSKTRFKEHVMDRRTLLVQCIESPIAEIRNPILALEFGRIPEYIDNDNIINAAINAIEYEINKWDGVQFSKKFITEYNKTGKIMDAKKFETIAKNHQDQTSWKISGNKFFAPYIAHSKQYIYQYCQCIINIGENLRTEIYKLACISYAVGLLEKTIKFHRTKPKPLIRHKTLVKSDGIHIELENLYNPLKVRAFISAAKKKRKAKDNKGTIIAKDFHQKLLDCCYTLYRDQKYKVYTLCGIDTNQIDDDSKGQSSGNGSIYPQDLMDSDGDHGNNGYEPYESSTLYSTHSSSNSTRSISRYNHNYDNISRGFQQVHTNDYSIRNDIKRDRKNEKKRIRKDYQESNIADIRNNLQNILENDNHHILSNNNMTLQDHDGLLLENVNNTQSSYSQYNNHIMDTNIGQTIDCTQCGESCHCQYDINNNNININNNTSGSIVDDILNDSNTTNSQSSGSDSRRCQQLQRENEELKRQKEILLQQIHNMDIPIYINQSQQFDQYPYQYQYQYPYSYQPQQFIMPQQNDNVYFNALPPQLQLFQPTMIIRGSSLNGTNYINNNHNNNNNHNINNPPPPFIDIENNTNNNNNNIIMDDQDIDITDVPPLPHSQSMIN